MRSPRQNGHVERIIGSIHRECLDHLIVFGERVYAASSRLTLSITTRSDDLSLDKDAPEFRRRQKIGRISAIPTLGGRHHQCVRFRFWIGTTAKPGGST
jgi:hypothetical protein